MVALFAKIPTLLGSLGDALKNTSFSWLAPVVDAIDVILLPLLVIVLAAGLLYAIVLGVNMARADSTEKREEAKKRVINVIIGIAIAVALILLFKLLMAELPKWLGLTGAETQG